MNDDDMDVLSAESQALVKAEKLRPNPPAEVDARILERVSQSLNFAPPSPLLSSLPPNPVKSVGTAGAALKLLLGAGLIAGGAMVGSVATQRTNDVELRALRQEIERLQERPTPKPTAPTAVGEAPPEQRPSAEPIRPAVVRPRTKELVAKPRPVATGESLQQENVLLERARTALLRRSPHEALDALEEHALKFPRGQLNEERDALMVQSLVGLGRTADAGKKAESFGAQYPDSVLLPAVNAAIR